MGETGQGIGALAAANGLSCIAFRKASSSRDLPLSTTIEGMIGTYAFQKSGGEFRTMMGTPVADAIQTAFDAGASIAGANCGTDLSSDVYLEVGKQIVSAANGRPTILQPNAGAPKIHNGEIFYDATPEDMAALACKLRTIGISIVGGCCGTTPSILLRWQRHHAR